MRSLELSICVFMRMKKAGHWNFKMEKRKARELKSSWSVPLISIARLILADILRNNFGTKILQSLQRNVVEIDALIKDTFAFSWDHI